MMKKQLYKYHPINLLSKLIHISKTECTAFILRSLGYKFFENGLFRASKISYKKMTVLEEGKVFQNNNKFFINTHNRNNLVESLVDLKNVYQFTVLDADKICDHKFDLLGSGPIQLGELIDWHKDYKTGYKWDPKTYYKKISPATFPGGYDIKVPWELSRCQHFVRLGQAYWFTSDEKYANEFVAEVEDWIEKNPWPWGVNWACTMDVAIRVVNWLWGYQYFMNSPIVSSEFRISFYKSLLTHGRHIRKNLEKHGGITNNHYLADLVGLIFLGILCPEFKEANGWIEFGTKELWKEMFIQVNSDGVNFESSIAYHRLAIELFLIPIILCQLNNICVSDEVIQRLEKMIEFTMYYTKPDGTVPLIGDSDNGRLVRLKVWDPPEREWLDHRYLLAIGAVMFGRQDFAQAAGDQWEEAIWLLGENAVNYKNEIENKKLENKLKLSSKGFVDTGIYIMRQNDNYMIINAGFQGHNGNEGHAHNDDMSFECYAYNQSWIIDPGTYTYTQDYNFRNLFRSTFYHNIISVNNEEINPFDLKSIFQLIKRNKPQVNNWKISKDFDLLCLENQIRNQTESPITHKRNILFEKRLKGWIIQDLLIGTNINNIDYYFHLPQIEINQINDNIFVLFNNNYDVSLIISLIDGIPLQTEIIDGWKSNGYGLKSISPIIHIGFSKNLTKEYMFCIMPFFNTKPTIFDIQVYGRDIVKRYQDLLQN